MLLWKLKALKLMESLTFNGSETRDLSSSQEVHQGTGSWRGWGGGAGWEDVGVIVDAVTGCKCLLQFHSNKFGKIEKQ